MATTIEMLRDYFGNRKGQTVDLGGVNEILVRRGFAKFVEPKQKRSPQAGKAKRKKANGS